MTRVAIVGAVILIVSNLPLILMTSRERGYLLTLGAVLMLTTGVVSLGRWLRARSGTVVTVAAALVVAALLAATTANRLQMFAPCSGDTRLGDRWLQEEMLPHLADEMGPWLLGRIQACDAASYRPLVESLPVATWRLPGGAITMLVTDAARQIHLHVRATSTAPVTVTIVVNGRPGPVVTLAPGTSLDQPIALYGSWRTALRRSHRIDIQASPGSAPEIHAGVVTY
jgi:hypothetical protein